MIQVPLAHSVTFSGSVPLFPVSIKNERYWYVLVCTWMKSDELCPTRPSGTVLPWNVSFSSSGHQELHGEESDPDCRTDQVIVTGRGTFCRDWSSLSGKLPAPVAQHRVTVARGQLKLSVTDSRCQCAQRLDSDSVPLGMVYSAEPSQRPGNLGQWAGATG